MDIVVPHVSRKILDAISIAGEGSIAGGPLRRVVALDVIPNKGS